MADELIKQRIYNAPEIEAITGDESLAVDESSFSNAMRIKLNNLATYVLGKTESEMHAETIYYNIVVGADNPQGGILLVSGTGKLVGIFLDDVIANSVARIAYAGKCQVLVKSDVNVVAGDYAIMDTSEYDIKVGDGTEIANRVGIFLETSAGGEDRLVWVLLKL